MAEPSRVNVSLIGYRATGKTRVGGALAAELDCEVIDTDQEVQRRAGKTIREIFEQRGEQEFRDWESQVLEDLLPNREQTIFSLGGGAILQPRNRVCIHAASVAVWLRASPEEIWRRLQGDAATRDQRPALTQLDGFNEIAAVLSARAPIYEKVADIQVDTENKSVNSIAREILLELRDSVRFPGLSDWLGS